MTTIYQSINQSINQLINNNNPASQPAIHQLKSINQSITTIHPSINQINQCLQ
jgi:hypothetical protein